MEPGQTLKTLLQLQLASDASVVVHLPFVLSCLSAFDFAPSSHLTKWAIRLTSLIHSKDPGARWAGLCIAHQTSLLSKSTMIDCAQNWIPPSFQLLASTTEPPPVVKASIRLLCTIFCSATDTAEFQRQVSMPNVPKYTTTLITLLDGQTEIEVKLLCLKALTELIRHHPSLVRPSATALNTSLLKILNGAVTQTSESLIGVASRLYSYLHLAGGKVGAANLWAKSMSETLAFAWNALRCLQPQNSSNSQGLGDAMLYIPLNVNRLRCATVVISDLLR
ncbi:hypothetical protein FISHEDRAFT_65399 [Fistulina hepatica ATCC 64428]|nr:hypothetical protein FISHEDRAFT_65399 [Fistulina hepatica ATCC 64428]